MYCPQTRTSLHHPVWEDGFWMVSVFRFKSTLPPFSLLRVLQECGLRGSRTDFDSTWFSSLLDGWWVLLGSWLIIIIRRWCLPLLHPSLGDSLTTRLYWLRLSPRVCTLQGDRPVVPPYTSDTTWLLLFVVVSLWRVDDWSNWLVRCVCIITVLSSLQR